MLDLFVKPFGQTCAALKYRPPDIRSVGNIVKLTHNVYNLLKVPAIRMVESNSTLNKNFIPNRRFFSETHCAARICVCEKSISVIRPNKYYSNNITHVLQDRADFFLGRFNYPVLGIVEKLKKVLTWLA
jgi:hypothetical protein